MFVNRETFMFHILILETYAESYLGFNKNGIFSNLNILTAHMNQGSKRLLRYSNLFFQDGGRPPYLWEQ